MPSRKKHTPEDTDVTITTRLVKDRMRARSIEHLMTHQPPCATCEGCQARARQSKHHKGAFDASPKDRSMIITLDQVTIQDLDFSHGYGGFRYGIVFCSLKSDYWTFIPLRSLECSDAHAAFRQFCIIHNLRSKEVVVYCDAHQSLRQICFIEGTPVEHPPTGRSERNPIIERKIGLTLACLRSASVTGGLPMCLWPKVAHAAVVNYQLFHKGSDGKTNYERAFGSMKKFQSFLSGELIFFRPSPTILSCTLAKSAPRLIPGIFLDYYTPRAGELYGQCIVRLYPIPTGEVRTPTPQSVISPFV